MKYEIKHRFSGEVLFALETDSLELCVEAAVKAKADLGGAYLGGAYLGGAYLGGAYFGDLKAEPEEVARLDAVREIVLNQPQRLDMGVWHGDKWTPDHTPEEEHSCGTAHCFGGVATSFVS